MGRKRILALCLLVIMAALAGPVVAGDYDALAATFVDPPIAEPICGAREDPLVRVRAHLVFASGFTSDKVVVVYKSGKAAMVTLTSRFAVDDLAPADRERVREELAAAQVGFAQDCTVDEVSGLNGLRGTVQVTWYGREPRRNAFTVTTAPTQTCSTAVQSLVFYLVLNLPVADTR
jgi:hypothetical protein